jgi:hypothetical protein
MVPAFLDLLKYNFVPNIYSPHSREKLEKVPKIYYHLWS